MRGRFLRKTKMFNQLAPKADSIALELLAVTEDLERIAQNVQEIAKEVIAAEKKLAPAKDTLRQRKQELDDEIAAEQSVQMAEYSVASAAAKSAKGTGATVPFSIINASDAAGRKAQMEAHLAQCAKDSTTPIGIATLAVRRAEMEVMQFQSQLDQHERELKSWAYVKDLQIARSEALSVLVRACALNTGTAAAV